MRLDAKSWAQQANPQTTAAWRNEEWLAYVFTDFRRTGVINHWSMDITDSEGEKVLTAVWDEKQVATLEVQCEGRDFKLKQVGARLAIWPKGSTEPILLLRNSWKDSEEKLQAEAILYSTLNPNERLLPLLATLLIERRAHFEFNSHLIEVRTSGASG